MMQRKGKASGLLMMVLAVFSGCSQTDYQVGQTAQRRWRPIDNEKMLRARQAPAPRIAPETHFAAGVLLEQQGQPGQAVDQFRRAIALNHKYAEAYHRLGVLLGMTGQHVEAEENLRKAVALKPQQAFFHNDLGFQLMQTKQWAEAETEFRAALDLYPRMPRANINLALAVSQQGRFDEALACFRTALPEADAQFNLGLIYKTQQRYSEASDCFRRALEERPTFVAAGTQLASCSQNMDGGQQTESFTQTTTTQPYQPRQQEFAVQNHDATIPITTSNESRPDTMAAQTMPEEPAQTYVAPAPASSSQDIEWIEVQTSDGPVSEDPITEPLLIEPEPAPLQPQPDPVQPQPTPSEPQSSMQPTSTFEPARIEWSKPEPMPITAYGYEPAPTPARSQPTPRSQPVSNSSAQEVYVVPMGDVGGAPSATTQPTHSPAPTTQPTTQVTPVVQPTLQSNATPAGYQDENPPPGMTPEEIRVWRAERRGQALWLEEQRTGKRVARTPTYFHESKYTTQIINEQAGTDLDSRSTMAATVYETKVVRTVQSQDVLPGEQPLAWLETIAPDNSQLQSAVNNLRCDTAPGSTEQDFSPLYEQAGYHPVPMTIVPPESPAAPVEVAPAQRPGFTGFNRSAQTSTSTMQTSSGEAVVPMTDPNDRSSR